jgi:CheY-like chemotaxis protein
VGQSGGKVHVESEPGRGTTFQVRAVTVHALGEPGNVMQSADGGEKALALARNCTRVVDLVVTDVVMPGTSGQEVAGPGRARGPRWRGRRRSPSAGAPGLLAR